MTYQKTKDRLNNIYGERISIHETDSRDLTIKFNIGANCKKVDIAAIFHQEYNYAMIWNIKRRRNHRCFNQNLSYSIGWENLVCINHEILPIYKKFIANNQRFVEKVIVIDIETLYKKAEDLLDLLCFDPNDKEFKDTWKNDTNNSDAFNDRTRISTSRWNRDQDFRKKVINAYNCQCAICRCSEEKILQAAHIKAVADGGTDDLSNGICLCANHHLMFDCGLIKIDFQKLQLSHVSNSVINMPWHKEFLKIYHGKIIDKL